MFYTKCVKKPHYEESTHNSFLFLVNFGHCLGLLPIKITSWTFAPVKFTWKSWKCLYSFILLAGFSTNCIFCVMNWTFDTFTFRKLARQLHQINAFISIILYLKLAKKWPKLISLWYNVDQIMNITYGCTKNLGKRIKIIATVILIAAIGEYFLSLIYHIFQTMYENNDVFYVEKYYSKIFPEIFSVVPFNGFTAIISTITMAVGHMIWSYNDLFIIGLSTALALRFKQVNVRLLLNEKKANSNEYWVELRADYNRLVHLSKKLEKYISYIVLLSYSANIFFLLLQLSNAINHLNQTMQILYYTYSLAFLIARLTAVSLYGAWISDESKEPVNCLNSEPSTTYNLEIRRLLLQISFNDVGLTGSKMFKVTRGLLLNVAGAIVTYELVMIQFTDSMGSRSMR